MRGCFGQNGAMANPETTGGNILTRGIEPNAGGHRPMRGISGRLSMNHSIITADRNTHLKTVVVALMAAIVVVTVGVATRLSASGIELAGVDPRPPVKVGVVKADRPVIWTSREDLKVR